MESSEMLTSAEAAAMLRMNVQVMLRNRYRLRLPFVQPFPKSPIKFRRADLERWQAEHADRSLEKADAVAAATPVDMVSRRRRQF